MPCLPISTQACKKHIAIATASDVNTVAQRGARRSETPDRGGEAPRRAGDGGAEKEMFCDAHVSQNGFRVFWAAVLAVTAPIPCRRRCQAPRCECSGHAGGNRRWGACVNIKPLQQLISVDLVEPTLRLRSCNDT